MEQSVIINSSTSIVTDYLKRITTFQGAMPQIDELPMSPDDAGKPIPPNVQTEHGVISLQPLQHSSSSGEQVVLWMDAQQWRILPRTGEVSHTSSEADIAILGLLSSGRVWPRAIQFTLESLSGERMRLIVQCGLESFQEYTDELVRQTVQRFGSTPKVVAEPRDPPSAPGNDKFASLQNSKQAALANEISDADASVESRNDEWWIRVLNFQNEWNDAHKGDRITNSDLANAAYVSEGTVRNIRSKLSLSKKTNTRTDLRSRSRK